MVKVKAPVFMTLRVGMLKLNAFLQMLENKDFWNVSAGKRFRDHLFSLHPPQSLPITQIRRLKP